MLIAQLFGFREEGGQVVGQVQGLQVIRASEKFISHQDASQSIHLSIRSSKTRPRRRRERIPRL